MIGLNLRMTETTAAIACAQLAKAPAIIEDRRNLALQLTSMVAGLPFIEPPKDDVGCKHVYYVWAARVTNNKRNEFVDAIVKRGMPIRSGYSRPLNEVFNPFPFTTAYSDGTYVKEGACPVTEKMEYTELITFEICAYDPKTRHLKQMREVIKRVTGEMS